MPKTAVRRTRDAARSRQAILDAAERLFAECGYEGTSLQDIGIAAGVSRGTPSYFFGSKEGLYRVVLERNFSTVSALLRDVRREAGERGEGAAEVLRRQVEGYIDFLVAHPAYVRLVQWEALAGGGMLREVMPHSGLASDTLAAVEDAVERGSFRTVDPVQLMISLNAMCWYPFAQRDTLMRALALDPAEPSFVAARKQHILELVLRGLQPD